MSNRCSRASVGFAAVWFSLLLGSMACEQREGGGRDAGPRSGEPAPPAGLSPRLVLASDEPAGDAYFMPESLGSGGALLDYDGDGDLDVLLLHGARGNETVPADRPWRIRLLRQDIGGRFVDVGAASGAGLEGFFFGVAAGDIDGDADLDLYLTAFGPDRLLRNEGDGSFTEVGGEAGIDNPAWGTSALFVDYDLDSSLDLFVVNYVEHDPAVVCRDRAGRRDYCGPAGFPGVHDLLYRNDGDGTFTDVSTASGIAGAAAPGLGVVAAELDGDRFPDLYVANDGDLNHLWINRGDGTFEEEAVSQGAATNQLGRAEAGMGVALGDLEDDGDWDLFVTHLRGETNTLYRRVGWRFQDDTLAAGLGGPSLAATGFGTGFADFDLDGDLDLFLVNGGVTRGPASSERGKGFWADYAEPARLFENHGGVFREATGRWPELAATVESGRGLAFGDVDRDGAPDLLVTTSGGGARLLLNPPGGRGNWLLVRAVEAGRDSLGATLTAVTGATRRRCPIASGSSYLSSSDAECRFGLGEAGRVDRLTVRWPDGATEAFVHLPANRALRIVRAARTAR